MENEYDFYFQYSDSVKVSDMSRNDLKNLIQTGESAFLEFKHSVSSPEKIAREIAAFANTKGGTLLIGVQDNGEMIGVEGYLEEEFLLNQAARDECIPEVPIQIELIHLGDRDILLVKVPEADKKPVYVKGKSIRQVYIRNKDESVIASDEMIELMKQDHSAEGVTFEYGEKEQLLFRFLNEYGDITVEGLSSLANVTSHTATKMLVNMVSAGVLEMFERKGVAHYTFSQKST